MGVYSELVECIYSTKYPRTIETLLFTMKLYRNMITDLEPNFPEILEIRHVLFDVIERIEKCDTFEDCQNLQKSLEPTYNTLSLFTVRAVNIYRKNPTYLILVRLSTIFERLVRLDFSAFFKWTKLYIQDYYPEGSQPND